MRMDDRCGEDAWAIDATTMAVTPLYKAPLRFIYKTPLRFIYKTPISYIQDPLFYNKTPFIIRPLFYNKTPFL